MSADPLDDAPHIMTLDEEIAHLNTLLCGRRNTAERVPPADYTDTMGALITRKAELCRQRDANDRIAHEGEEQWRA